MINQLSLFGDEIKQNGKNEQGNTVISASRRTDIPAFYFDWLQEVLAKESVDVPNPLFPDKIYTVDLRPASVHSIVLWSKNFKNVFMKPMLLNEYNLYFQYTINNYARSLEPNVPDYKETRKNLEGLLKNNAPEQFNIRFDPIIISTMGEINPTPEMPEKARIKAFGQLCSDLKVLGMDNCRITTSYLSMYGHVKNRLAKGGLDIKPLDEKNQIAFFTQMAEVAQKYGFSLYTCASPILENVQGIQKGHCIDGTLLEKLFGGKIRKSKDNGQRKACGCTYSREIGIYSRNSDGMKCRHSCKYCYVVDS